jgi:uncharacterized protein YbaA (DUF1428 family)
MENDTGNKMQLLVYRVPKKNHDAMIKLAKKFYDVIGKMGDSPRAEIFQLDNIGTPMEGITNIANTVSANQDEEVWVESLSYKDRKHMDEYCEKCKNDENMDRLWQKFVNLGTPGTSLIMGDFSRLRV